MNNIIKNGQYKMERTLNKPLDEHTPVYVSIDELDHLKADYESIKAALREQSESRLSLLHLAIEENTQLKSENLKLRNELTILKALSKDN
jgi:hypothetical protein